jgi:alpha-tubulin suppressor-like RCC1 family protein
VNITDFSAVANGNWHSVGLRADGTVWCWGPNWFGELGDNSLTPSAVPVQALGLSNVVAVAAGSGFSMALGADGTVFTWGDNNFSTLGIPGPNRAVPTAVPGLTCATAIAAGSLHAMAVLSDGTAMSWGYNVDGRLGVGTFGGLFATPTAMVGVTDAVAAVGGEMHSVILRADGTLLACGDNYRGQLGNGTQQPSHTPVPVLVLTSVTQISSTGAHTIALRNDGTAWIWGANSYYQHCNGTSQDGYVPTPVLGLNGVAGIATTLYTSGFVRADGTVAVCGGNYFGGLGISEGIGSSYYVSTPLSILNLTGVTSLIGGYQHLTALAAPQGAAFVAHPASRVGMEGQAISFQLQATGTPQLVYQWFKDGQAISDGGRISGTTTPVLTIDPVLLADSGMYTATVSNAYGSQSSNAAVLVVTNTPGDINGDNLVGLVDFLAFADCAEGPALPPIPVGPGLSPEACIAVFDLVEDGHIDLLDFMRLQIAFNP